MEAVLLFWAAVRVGAAIVPLDPALPTDKITGLLERIRPSLVLVDGDRAGLVPAGLGGVLVVDGTCPDGEDAEMFADWLDDRGPIIGSLPAPGSFALQPAVVLFTSGTTGKPKGVVLSHQALLNSARLMAEIYEWRNDDVLVSPGELHTMSGLRNPVVASVVAGCSITIEPTDQRATAIGISEMIDRHNGTLLTAVPATLMQLLNIRHRLRPEALKSLRRVLTTGSFLSPVVRAEFESAFGVEILSYYGLTETAGFCAGDLPNREPCIAPCIGVPVEAMFMVSDIDGEAVGESEIGELWIQSPNLMLEYFDDPCSTNAAFSGPWFRTGDLGLHREDGTVELIGRSGDIVKGPHGEIISGREIEEALRSHPEVLDATTAIFDGTTKIDELYALVVPVPGSDSSDEWLFNLRAFLHARLGGKNLPSRLQTCTSIERTATGTVRREWLLEVIGDV